MTRKLVVLAGLLLVVPILAQQSPNYQLSDHTFNVGGHTQLLSTSYQLTFVSIGDGTVGSGLSSTSYWMEGSFGAAYPPPGEVRGLRFSDAETLLWNPERSANDYNLYRDLLSNLVSLSYGNCEQQNLPVTAVTDNDPVPTGDGYFYIVTVENRLGEEGTKGFDSSDFVRDGAVCP